MEMTRERLARIRWMLTPKLGWRTARVCLERFGVLGPVLDNPKRFWSRIPGLRKPQARALERAAEPDEALEELASLKEVGARIVCEGDADFPECLLHLHDPPLAFSLWGDLPRRPAVAIVGSRKATPYGLRQARRFAAGLARAGCLVVSGMALGIDGAAHRAALEAGGPTIAVLGSGFGHLYPKRHRKLARQITNQGGLVTEFPFTMPPKPGHFPRRNRIVSGLSRAVLIVEATKKSGSLITASWALEQGREIFALPGPVDRPESQGTNRLCREGAILVTEPAQILEELGISEPDGTDAPHRPELEGLEGRLVEAIRKRGEAPLDTLIDDAGQPAHKIFAALTRLELKKRVKRYPGRIYAEA